MILDQHKVRYRIQNTEDGSLYQNGSRDAKAKKIYLAVERKDDGGIDEVKQVTIEDAVQKMADR